MRRSFPLVSLILIALIISAPIAFLTPVPFSDDGCYMHMLDYFLRSGHVDHVFVSSAAVVGQILMVAPLASLWKFGILQFDLAGCGFSLLVYAGVFAFAQRRVSSNAAFALSLSLFSFPYFILTAPSFMTDMPFLALFVWWLYFTDRILSHNESTDKALLFFWIAWVTLLLLATMTRSTIALALPGFLLAVVVSPSERKKLSLLFVSFVCTVLCALFVVKQIAIHSAQVIDATTFVDVFIHHKLSSFHIRKHL